LNHIFILLDVDSFDVQRIYPQVNISYFFEYSSGHRIGTAEVESALVSHPKCAEAAVVGIDHEVTFRS
jgi:hypothetical protein